MQAFAHLKRVLSAIDPEGKLELVIVDADGCPDLYEAFGNMHGAGETVWVKAGRILFSSLMTGPVCFPANTESLLRECAGSCADQPR